MNQLFYFVPNEKDCFNIKEIYQKRDLKIIFYSLRIHRPPFEGPNALSKMNHRVIHSKSR